MATSLLYFRTLPDPVYLVASSKDICFGDQFLKVVVCVWCVLICFEFCRLPETPKIIFLGNCFQIVSGCSYCEGGVKRLEDLRFLKYGPSHRSEGFLRGTFHSCTCWSKVLASLGKLWARRRRLRRHLEADSPPTTSTRSADDQYTIGRRPVHHRPTTARRPHRRPADNPPTTSRRPA